jgi:hypothetical protein
MTDYLIDNDLPAAGKLLPIHCHSLTPEQITQASQFSEAAPSEAEQWYTYLVALALLGTNAWFQERAPELRRNSSWLHHNQLRPRSSSAIQYLAERIAPLQIGEFKLHLLAVDDLQDSLIPVPRSAIDQPEAVPHFYLLVEVLEEVGQICVYSFLRHDQLLSQQQTHSLQLEDETTYLVPLNWFETDLDRLLLYLRCLESTAIPLPGASPAIPLAQRALNVWSVLQEQLDAIAQDIGWILLPPPSLSPTMRGTRLAGEAFETMLTELVQRRGIDIPPAARGAYRDLQWENLALRLYVTTWQLPAAENNLEWSMLLVLGTQNETFLPLGLQLQVQDATQILENPIITASTQGYLYARVLGEANEQFWVTISLPDGAALTLPPFTFSPATLP